MYIESMEKGSVNSDGLMISFICIYIHILCILLNISAFSNDMDYLKFIHSPLPQISDHLSKAKCLSLLQLYS